MPWYKTGTVTVTNGSKNVVGVGTTWKSGVNPGDAFSLVDANGAAVAPHYEIESITDDENLLLVQAYGGATASGAAYRIWNLTGESVTAYLEAKLADFFLKFKGVLTDATGYVTQAMNWACKTDGTVDGTNYSAKYYAQSIGDEAAQAKSSADSAANSATAAGNSATAAGLSAGDAATSEANAKTSENNAKTSETAANTSAGAAKTSETNAKTSETNAQNSATAAAESAASAAAAFTNYEEISGFTRTGDNTFTMSGDVAADFPAGKLLRWNDSDTYLCRVYGTPTVANSVTTVTVWMQDQTQVIPTSPTKLECSRLSPVATANKGSMSGTATAAVIAVLQASYCCGDYWTKG